jgi:hypothetical protein
MLLAAGLALLAPQASAETWKSAVGDPGLRAERPSVLVVGWSFCNEAAQPPGYSNTPSPRWADCAGASLPSDNELGPGDPFPLPGFNATSDVNGYAVEKELFLGARCAQRFPAGTAPGGETWSFHTVMLKTGNMDPAAGICPSTNANASSQPPLAARFNNLPMVQPLVALTPAAVAPVPYGGRGYVGSVGATYDVAPNTTEAERQAVRAALAAYTAEWAAKRFAEVDGAPAPAPTPPPLLTNKSFEAAIWWRNVTSNSTVFHHIQSSSPAAPWLMNYFKLADARGVAGGYDWENRGSMLGPVPSYKSRLTVAFTQLTSSNLYLPCHGGCWKLNGDPCDGGAGGGSNSQDITRYVCFKVNGGASCSGNGCPLYHVRSSDGKRVLRNDSAFPRECYAMHCGPGGGGVGACDPFSNPGPQELMMLNPCSEWGLHGYPTRPGEGSGAGPLVFDVGALGARVALVGEEPQDVGAALRAARGWAPLPPPSQLPPYPGWTRSWVGFDFGTEQFSPAANRYEFSQVDLEVLAA